MLWAVCDEWLLWAKICGALVYSGNIMYNKFHLHFSSYQITFYPIRRCFLCWLKGTLKQTVLQPLLHCSLSSSPTVSHPHFSNCTSSSPPLVCQSYLSYYFPSAFPSHPLTLHFYRQGESHNAEITVFKCAALVCNATGNCSFLNRNKISDWVYISLTYSLLVLSQHFTVI